MNIEQVREFCLSLPLVTEDQAFGEDHLLFRLCNKIFACLSLDGDGNFAMKCNPEYAIELRDRYPGITPAYHWNKKFWNQITLSGSFSDSFIQSLIRHAYSEVVAKLPKKFRTDNPSVTLIR